jgi:hypothetical protein
VKARKKAEIIPPRSIVKLRMDVRGWKGQEGKTFRIGYYRKQDGLDCVWLVNAEAEYEQTTDQYSIQTEFDVLELSEETDLLESNDQSSSPWIHDLFSESRLPFNNLVEYIRPML